MSTPHPLAPRWRRSVCLCYEVFLTSAVVIASAMLFQLLLPKLAGSVLEFVYMVAVTHGYFAWCWRKSGQTLAMKTWRLRLMSRDGALDWRRSAIRFTCLFLAFMPLPIVWAWWRHEPAMKWTLWIACGWALLPYLWSLLDKEGQFLHDRVAGTFIELMPVSRD